MGNWFFTCIKCNIIRGRWKNVRGLIRGYDIICNSLSYRGEKFIKKVRNRKRVLNFTVVDYDVRERRHIFFGFFVYQFIDELPCSC